MLLQKNLYSQHDLYTKMMNFINKNKKIPAFLEQTMQEEDHLANATALEEAISKGKADDPIFNHQYANMYLLYLIKEKRIADEQAITVLILLTAKASPLYAKDIHVISINQNSDMRNAWFENVFRSFVLPINKMQCSQEIESFSGIDEWMIALPRLSRTDPNSSDEHKFLNEISRLVPYLSANINGTQWIPSIKIMEVFARQINPTPIQFYPMYGKINLRTLHDMHAEGFHPLALNGGEFVRDNVNAVHGISSVSPLVILMHDIYHTYSGTLLPKAQHDFLYKILLPFLRDIIKQLETTQKLNDESFPDLIDALNKLCNDLIDMDLGIHCKSDGYSNELLIAGIRRRDADFDRKKHDPEQLTIFYQELYQLPVKHYEEIIKADIDILKVIGELETFHPQIAEEVGKEQKEKHKELFERFEKNQLAKIERKREAQMAKDSKASFFANPQPMSAVARAAQYKYKLARF